MAGPLCESAPRPVSVVVVDGSPGPDLEDETNTQIQQDQNQQHQENHHIQHQELIQQNGRSFASTEAQTEPAPQLMESVDIRDARRRERRLRRHRRAIQRSGGPLLPPPPSGQAPTCVTQYTGLPPPQPQPPGIPAGIGLGPPLTGYLHPPPPHLGLRGLSLGLPFPVPASVSAFGR